MSKLVLICAMRGKGGGRRGGGDAMSCHLSLGQDVVHVRHQAPAVAQREFVLQPVVHQSPGKWEVGCV